MEWGNEYCAGCIRNRECYCRSSNTGTNCICPIWESSMQVVFEKEYNRVNKREK